MKLPFLRLLLPLVMICLGEAQAATTELRTFTNARGASIKARLVGVKGDQVTIQREDGQNFVLPLSSLSPADQAYIKAAANSLSAVPASSGPQDKVEPSALNEAIGAALFADEALWQSDAAAVAQRLQLPQESKTQDQSSYRLYPKPDLKWMGAHPYSVALYAQKDKVTSLSLVFANKGDLFGAKGSGEMHFDKDTPPEQAGKIVREAMDKDLQAIAASLTKLLGEPRKERFGERGAGRMNMQRWDWRGHALLLADAQSEDKEPEYVGLQIVPSAFADAGGKAAKVSDAQVREFARSSLERRPNGDVVLKNIPMVDQGPKGYCAPATVERAMRFMGMPADMYVLANAGSSGYGGGTSLVRLFDSVGRLIRSKSRSFDSWQGKLELKDVARWIDRGIPVMWLLQSTEEFNKIANRRSEERRNVSDWASWKTRIESESAQAKLPKDKETNHVVLIIGYNKDTGEMAFSDSWGERFVERWISFAEAAQISLDGYYAIGF
jgi:hypothetical protein